MTSYDRIAGLSFKLPTWLAKNHYRENTSRFAERARVGVCVFGKRGGGGLGEGNVSIKPENRYV